MLSIILDKIVIISIYFVLTCIQHELGHYLFGKIAGFKLVFIEIMGIRCSFKPKFLVRFNFKINAKICMVPHGTAFLRRRYLLFYLGGMFVNVSSLIFAYFAKDYLLCLPLCFAVLMAILPIRKSDFLCIYELFDSEHFLVKQIQAYQLNNISPQNMPEYLFQDQLCDEVTDSNYYIYKIYYYRLLESGEKKLAIECFEKIKTRLQKSTLNKDKFEILFYYTFINPDLPYAQKLKNEIVPSIGKSKHSYDERLLLTMSRLDYGEMNKEYHFVTYKSTGNGLQLMEKKIINNFVY